MPTGRRCPESDVICNSGADRKLSENPEDRFLNARIMAKCKFRHLMRPLTKIFLLAVLVGCSSTEGEMLDIVRKRLNDPKSAEFAHLKHHEFSDGSGRILCGMVNYKNKFGGYDGAKPFVVGMPTDEGEQMLVEIGDDAIGLCESFIKYGEEAASKKRQR